tara:strand:- start:298 stop:567 length:270 start_codon:yes stop_codon:yes gene_type:complete
MTDSTPDSINEFIMHLSPNKKLVACLENNLQLIEWIQKYYSNDDDDEIANISSGQLKSMLNDYFFWCKSYKEVLERLQAFIDSSHPGPT